MGDVVVVGCLDGLSEAALLSTAQDLGFSPRFMDAHETSNLLDLIEVSNVAAMFVVENSHELPRYYFFAPARLRIKWRVSQAGFPEELAEQAWRDLSAIQK